MSRGIYFAFLLVWGCGIQPSKKERGEKEKVTPASCSTSVDSRSKSCVDYEGLTASQLEPLSSACVTEGAVERTFNIGDLCPVDEAIGSCRVKGVGGIFIKSWTYSSGEDLIDGAALDAAKKTCEEPSDGSWPGTWQSRM